MNDDPSLHLSTHLVGLWIDWYKTNVTGQNVTIGENLGHSPCNNKTHGIYEFHRGLSYLDAKIQCNQLGGQLYGGWNQSLIKHASSPTTYLIPRNGLSNATKCNGRFWMAIIQGQKIARREWEWVLDGKNTSVITTPLPWRISRPNGLHFKQCVTYHFNKPKTMQIEDMKCNDLYCASCEIPYCSTFYLRGKVPKDVGQKYIMSINVMYYFTNHPQVVTFDGLGSGEMIWNITAGNTVLYDNKGGKLMTLDKSPFGMMSWKHQGTGKVHSLHFSQVSF